LPGAQESDFEVYLWISSAEEERFLSGKYSAESLSVPDYQKTSICGERPSSHIPSNPVPRTIQARVHLEPIREVRSPIQLKSAARKEVGKDVETSYLSEVVLPYLELSVYAKLTSQMCFRPQTPQVN
jgi:hypothetical protein